MRPRDKGMRASAAMVTRNAVRLAATIGRTAVRALPRAARFAAVRRCARLLTPALRGADIGRWPREHLTSSTADTALFAHCEVLDRGGILYDPDIQVHGEDALDTALRRDRGLILLTVHGLLSNLLIRYYEVERRLAPTMVAVSDRTSFVSGTGRRPDVLIPSRSFLLHLRTRLRERKVVFAMVDRMPEDPRALHFTTRHGGIAITDSMLRLAVRLDVPVLFTTCHVQGRSVVLRMEPVTAASGTLADLTAALVARIEADMDRVAAEA